MSNGYIKGNPDVSWWLTQIRNGIKYRNDMAERAKWNTWRKMYRGKWKDGVLPVNLMFKMARTVVPRIYFRNPSISITPAQPGMLNWAFAQLLESVDNQIIRKMKVKKHLKRIVGNTWFFGTGCAKVGYGALYNYDVSEFGGDIPLLRGGRRVDYNSDMRINMPWVDSVHPGNLIVPMGLADYEKAPWVAEWIQRPLADVRDDPRLKNNKELRKGGASKHQFGSNLESENNPVRDHEMVDLIEVHDLRYNRVFVIAPYVTDRVLFYGDDDLVFFGKPNYMPLVFNENDNSFWGVPDSQILEPDQLEINEIRTMMMIHWRLSVLKLIYQKGKVDPSELQKVVDGEILSAIGVTGDVRSAMSAMQVGDIPDSLFKADLQINQDVREAMGFSRNEFGEHTPASSRTTATESRIVKMASEIRVDERRDMAADLLLDVVDHVNRIIFNHWTEEQVVQVAGPMGVPLWIRFRPQMLKEGAYNINIDPDSSLPQTKEQRESRALVMYEQLKQNPLIDPVRLTRYLLHEMHGVQFDDMMRGMPPGMGGPTQPLDLQQYVQLTTQIAQKAPQALVPIQGVREPVNTPEEEPL